ncbi:hypothetical protein [Enterobacter cloacae]|uniref:hypothetical protein n=1 Tax=Enterobacter cloacae TaxID=550 RepID=UPI001F555A3B|nr:hypothetical protein [Enterobacter cloacae]
MSIITREQAKDLRNAFQCWQQDYDPVEDKEQYDMFGLGMVAMDALLASLEPVSVFKIDHESSLIKHVKKVVSETNAPPAPVSVPAAMEMDDDFDSAFEHGKAVGWNAYRAAMLQSFGNSEQLNSPVIPDGWVMVPRMLTPRMITKLQQNTEIGSYIAANWAGAYDLFQKFWDEAIAAAPQQESKP